MAIGTRLPAPLNIDPVDYSRRPIPGQLSLFPPHVGRATQEKKEAGNNARLLARMSTTHPRTT